MKDQYQRGARVVCWREGGGGEGWMKGGNWNTFLHMLLVCLQ